MRILRSSPVLGLPLLLGIACAAAAAAGAQGTAAGPYHIAHRYTVGGEGGWDYLALDTAGNRLFVTRSDRVMVLDPASGRVLGEIPGLQRGHGVAFAYPTGHGFVTSGADSTVTMFDLKTLKVLGHTIAAVDDDAVLYDPASRRVFTFNGDANSASVIDAASGQRIGSIALGGKPEFGVSAGDGKLYVNIEDRSEVVELDARAMRVLRRWPLAPCESPSGLAIDAAHHRLFSVCHNKVMAVSDVVAGRVVASAPIGSGVDAARFDAGTEDAFASNGDGTLTVVHEDAPDRYRVVQTIPTAVGARTMELDPRTHRLYTVTARFGPAPAAAPGATRRPRPPMLPGTFELLVLER